MKIKHYIILLICLFSTLSANAVLKEDSLANTLKVLRGELTKSYEEFNQREVMLNETKKQVVAQLLETMRNSNENALMLYSQKDGYVFDLSYACHEAKKQYMEFKMYQIPFRTYVAQCVEEEARMDSLINCLETMPQMLLSEKVRTDRNVCLALAVNMKHRIHEENELISEYINVSKMTEQRLKSLNDYANKKYDELQNSIFVNGGDSYLAILSDLNYYLMETKENMAEKYSTVPDVNSQWDGRFIVFLFSFILLWSLISILLNQLLIRWLLTKCILNSSYAAWFMDKRKAIIMASTVITFAIILGVIKTFAAQNFFQMAAGLLIQYAWLLGVVIISLIVRTKSEQTIRTFFVYLPLLVNGFVVITFRIILIPNTLVNLIFPPLLLICCIWQWFELHRSKREIDHSDLTFAYISQIVFVSSFVSSISGYTLLSVQILIWWIMQLTCVLTIACFRGWYKNYAEKKKLWDRPITQMWYHRFIYWVILPIAAVFSIVLSLYWAADVFNLSDLTIELFTKPFVDTDNFSASIFSIAIVVSLWFIFDYINHNSKMLIKYMLEKKDPENAAQRFMMIKNVMQIFIWGIWFLVTLTIFHVSNTWILVIGGGLSTGIGFALKDILENIYYGISLMMGRVKIGDLIVCDGIRGTVSSISYISTMIDTVDGSVIAFQNSQLFTKNYKNMTMNHGYEMHILDVGIAYGSNVKQAKQVIINAVKDLDCINKEKGVGVVLKELGDSALVLKVCVWVNVFTAYGDDGHVLEAIYEALNEANIEIPFPQMDVSLRSISPKVEE